MEYQNFSNPRVWVAALLGLGLLGLLAICYPALIANLHDQWTTSGELDFGYLVLAAAAAIFLRYHLSLPPWAPIPSYLMFSLAGGLLAFYGLWIHVQALLILGLVTVWWASIVALFGRSALTNASLVAGLLLLSTPLLFLAIPLLRTMTVAVVTNLVSLFGIVVYVEGNLVHMPTGIIEIADGCSGTKYFHSAIVLALITIGFNLSSKNWLKIVAVLAAVALIANWIRVFILVVWAYFYGVQDPLILDHDWLGWVVFAATIFPALHLLTNEPMPSKESTPEQSGTASRAHRTKSPTVVFVAIASAVCLSLPTLSYQTLDDKLPWQQASLPLPVEFQNCESSPVPWAHGFIGADLAQASRFSCKAQTKNFVVASAQYLLEDQGKELVFWTNGPLDSNKWQIVSRREVTLENGVRALEWTARNRFNSETVLAIFNYSVGNMSTHRRVLAKLMGLLRLLGNQPAPRATVVIMNCDVNCDKASPKAKKIFQSYLAAQKT